MFTLKLYQNGPLPPEGRSVIMEVAGVWVDHCEGNLKHVHAFKKTVGVQDEDGPHDFYVGGDFHQVVGLPANQIARPADVSLGRGGNHYGWGVLENAQGKTTEMFR